MREVEKLASVRRLYRTVAIDFFHFFMKPSSILQHISVSYSKAQLIGDWYENRRGARNTIIFLIISQYYWLTDAPFKTALSPHGNYGRRKFPLHLCTISVSVLSLRFRLIRGAGNFGKGMEGGGEGAEGPCLPATFICRHSSACFCSELQELEIKPDYPEPSIPRKCKSRKSIQN